MERDLFEEAISIFDGQLKKLGVEQRIDGLAFLEDYPYEDKFISYNKGSDIVFCNGSEKYHVDYEWFKSDESKIRIELMKVRAGAPYIHDLFEKGQILHASFKMQNYAAYHEMLKKLNGWLVCEEHFVAEYGLFSYWKIPGVKAYLKPRVNLRDV